MRMRAPISCPQCSYLHNAETGLFGARTPSAGDVSICIRCSTLNVYTITGGVLGLRVPDQAELDRFLADERIVSALAALAVMREGRRRR